MKRCYKNQEKSWDHIVKAVLFVMERHVETKFLVQELKVLVKQQFAAILAKGESSGVQGSSGQDFVLHALILRV